MNLTFPTACPLAIVVRDSEDRPIRGAALVYTFDAIAPFTSRQLVRYEPQGFGANESDAGYGSSWCSPPLW